MKINEWMYQSVIGVLVIIILLLTWWIASRPGFGVYPAVSGKTATTTNNVTGPSTVVKSSASTSQPSSATTVSKGDSVSISNQSASKAVMVSELNVPQQSWVAIRDSNGRILGAAWFAAGKHTKVTVPLLRSTTAGQKYQVLLYADNGDRIFDLHKDILITNSGGAVAGTTFTAEL